MEEIEQKIVEEASKTVAIKTSITLESLKGQLKEVEKMRTILENEYFKALGKIELLKQQISNFN